jgi:hypothetical protein
MSALDDSCRSLASPSVFEEVLDGGGALSGREEWAEEADYDNNARKLDFEGPLRALVLLHTTAYESARDLTWAAEEDLLFDLLFKALGADVDISVRGLGGAMASRPIEPYWKMLKQVQGAVEELPHQRLRGVSTGEWGEITDLFGTVDLFDATQIDLPSTLADWQKTSEEKSGFKLQLKLDGTDGQFKEALSRKARWHKARWQRPTSSTFWIWTWIWTRRIKAGGARRSLPIRLWLLVDRHLPRDHRVQQLFRDQAPRQHQAGEHQAGDGLSGLSPTRRPIRRPMRPVIRCCPTNTFGSGMIEQIETGEIRTDGIECSLWKYPRRRRFRSWYVDFPLQEGHLPGPVGEDPRTLGREAGRLVRTFGPDA